MVHILSMARRLHMVQTEENKQKGTRTHNSHVQPCITGEIIRQAAGGLPACLRTTLVSYALGLCPVICT